MTVIVLQEKLRSVILDAKDTGMTDQAVIEAGRLAFEADSLISELSGALAILNTESMTDEEVDIVHDALTSYRKWRDEE